MAAGAGAAGAVGAGVAVSVGGVGLAAAEGKLSLDDPVLKYFPEEAPAELTASLRGFLA